MRVRTPLSHGRASSQMFDVGKRNVWVRSINELVEVLCCSTNSHTRVVALVKRVLQAIDELDGLMLSHLPATEVEGATSMEECFSE